ncbi:MAG: NAD(P)-dependent oxidoreductase, partial [Candidatus Woesebacteria bacterium]|nr:NAD(P)-dependent oxidoreductase [Candidatus Woesebacteria bacterium]
ASIPIDDPKNDVISRYQILDDTSLTESIVQTLRKVKVEKFVFLSSVFAYGDCDGWSTSETTVLNPKTHYGISKAVGEYIIKAYLDNWNIIRTTSVYGFGDSNLRATQIFINKALNNDNFWVNADTLLDFIYIKDLVGGIADVALSGFKKENFHITGGKALRLVDYVNEIKKYFPKIRYKVKIGLNDRPKRATMDNTKARILLGWEPKYSLAEGVRDYIKYSKKYKIG